MEIARRMTLRSRLFEALETDSKPNQVARTVNSFIIGLILANVLAVILQTVEPIANRFDDALLAFELFSVAVFGLEYLARLWVATERPNYHHWLTGRIRYALTPMALIDLIAILPALFLFVPVDLRFLRVLRLARLARVFKLGRYSDALNVLSTVMARKREELIVTLSAVFGLIVIAASLMYFIEGPIQPDAFSSIPATMWWAVATLTTVGYGDVYPLTPVGKLFGSALAILCLGIFALPAGILAGGFSELMTERKLEKHVCPKCGTVLQAD